MMKFLSFIIYLLLFFLILKFIRLLTRYWASTKSTVNRYKESQKVKTKFENIEEAEFREIKEEPKKENEENKP